ncbi:NAD-dependent epimerase/dehydratase family protein [Sinomicrobium pectinilyticum]|uniref:NAD-dependent epimerase/dehydratase family protein n=1 Tax=Sinomicrobium pectinilyticum TaxID=1084421 RepID=A0A3N0E1E4_SINP1|nr:NAD-dependent epimerase/dehydratase family protein [Sinomicrobium pectinilyticum]RNL81630.1 NAD-dependent epimerase/dehydratase family protein [Sinomicrobium pectinilyticum]
MQDNSYLLTGASGFLGKILQRMLIEQKNKVIGLDRGGQPILADITKPFDIEKRYYFDTVVHCAGKAHVVPRTQAEIDAFYHVNFEGTKHLCQALEHLGAKPKALIFISTVAVYGRDRGERIDESSPLNGNTPYAKSKAMAEEWLNDWGAKNEIKIGIIRLPLLAGPNPPGNLGAMIHGIKTGKYLSIGKANARKSMVWAADIANLIPRLAEIGGTYNLTDGYDPSFHELEQAIASELGKKPPIKIPKFVANLLGYAGDVLGDRFPVNSDKLNKITSTLTFDDSKARKILGWNPTSVLDHINEMVNPNNK